MAHPLDPLAGDEFRAVASILRREHGVGDGWRFASIELAEPSKTELRAFDDGGAPPRRAEVVCLQRSNNTTYKSMVSLTDDRVESFEHIPGVQANFTADTPEVMGEYVPGCIPERIGAASRREPLKPLHITQPEGPSFTLDGNLLQWQNWSLRIGFNHREGMTLHAVRYRDGDRNRSVAHRLSFAEMIYRDPSADHYRRTAFDIGEWGLGFMTTSLELGCGG